MSYSRGEVYLVGTDEDELTCYGCKLLDEPFADWHGDECAAWFHIVEHRAAGHEVNDDAFARLGSPEDLRVEALSAIHARVTYREDPVCQSANVVMWPPQAPWEVRSWALGAHDAFVRGALPESPTLRDLAIVLAMPREQLGRERMHELTDGQYLKWSDGLDEPEPSDALSWLRRFDREQCNRA